MYDIFMRVYLHKMSRSLCVFLCIFELFFCENTGSSRRGITIVSVLGCGYVVVEILWTKMYRKRGNTGCGHRFGGNTRLFLCQ